MPVLTCTRGTGRRSSSRPTRRSTATFRRRTGQPSCPNCGNRLLHRAAHVQRPAAPRPGVEGRVRAGLPVRPETARGVSSTSATCCRPRAEQFQHDGGVARRPDRRRLHLPDQGVRADGDGVLRPPGHRRGLAPVLDRASAWLNTGLSIRENLRLYAARKTLSLFQAHRGHRVQVQFMGAKSGELEKLVTRRRDYNLAPRRRHPTRTSTT